MKLNVKRNLMLLWCLATCVISNAYAFSAKNKDGVTIYYSYNAQGTELEVICENYDQENSRASYSGTIVIPDSVTFMNRTRAVTGIYNYAFANCSIDSLYIPSTVRYIGIGAFYRCDIEKVRLPEGLQAIHKEAFRECKMKSINIPSTVWSIHEDVFLGCYSLKKVIVSDIGAWCRIDFSYSKISEEKTASNPLIYDPEILYSDENTRIQNLVIPEGVTYIHRHSFSYANFKSIKLPKSLKVIEEYAFAGNKSVPNIDLNDGLEVIEKKAFYNCSSLASSLILPESLVTIGRSAFENCNFTNVYLPKNLTSIGGDAFQGYDMQEVVSFIQNPFKIAGVFSTNTVYNATLYVPVGTKTKYKKTFDWDRFVYIVEGIPASVQNVTLDKSKNIPVYDVNGRRLVSPQKGINIIGVKKVLVK